MAQPVFSSTPRSAQFLPPSLHPRLALLGEVVPPGLFKMSLPLGGSSELPKAVRVLRGPRTFHPLPPLLLASCDSPGKGERGSLWGQALACVGAH